MKLIILMALICLSHLTHAETVQFTVAGSSMAPTLMHGETIEVDTLVYAVSSPQLNDLVSVRFANRGRPVVKRVVAMEGDSVHIDGEGLWRNQTIIADPDRFRTKSKGLALAVQLERYEYVVPKGHLILLGDNPLGSKDSLRYGLVSVKQVEGKVINIGDQPECSNTLELEPEYSRASAPIF